MQDISGKITHAKNAILIVKLVVGQETLAQLAKMDYYIKTFVLLNALKDILSLMDNAVNVP